MKIIRVILCISAGMLCLLSACQKQTMVQEEIIRPVVTMKAPGKDATRNRAFAGTVSPAMETLLSFRVGGEIEALSIRKGMDVKTGMVLASLDATDHELQYNQSQAQLESSKAQLKQAEAEYERFRQLYETKSISKSDLDAQKAVYDSADAAYEAAMKAMELTKKQLDYCVMKAPMDGAIISVSAEVHETVSAGQTIAAMTAGDALEVEVGVPEALIAAIHVGDACRVQIDAVKNDALKARVSEVGIRPSQAGTYPVTLQLLEEHAGLRLGMVAEVIFSISEVGSQGAIIVPLVAVASTPEGGRYIWIVNPETHRVEKRDVTIGTLTSEGLQIVSGLEPAEIVVIRGVHKLTDGMKVTLIDE